MSARAASSTSCIVTTWREEGTARVPRRLRRFPRPGPDRLAVGAHSEARITDHRIKFSVHNLEQFLAGHMDEMLKKLLEEERIKKLSALAGKK